MKRVIGFSIIVLLCVSHIALAQIQIGTVGGVVFDATGAVLADAKVTLENPLTGSKQLANTDNRGAFIFNNVPFAQYHLRVEANAFQPAMQSFTVLKPAIETGNQAFCRGCK